LPTFSINGAGIDALQPTPVVQLALNAIVASHSPEFVVR